MCEKCPEHIVYWKSVLRVSAIIVESGIKESVYNQRKYTVSLQTGKSQSNGIKRQVHINAMQKIYDNSAQGRRLARDLDERTTSTIRAIYS